MPTDLDPNNQTRSDARRGYYDPYIGRPNFHVMTGQQCTRILIDGHSANPITSAPTTGGTENGEGSAGSGQPIFGENSGTPPPALHARDYLNGLRANGVEVSNSASFSDSTKRSSLLPTPRAYDRQYLAPVKLLLHAALFTRPSFSNCLALDPAHYSISIRSQWQWTCPGSAVTCKTTTWSEPFILVSSVPDPN